MQYRFKVIGAQHTMQGLPGGGLTEMVTVTTMPVDDPPIWHGLSIEVPAMIPEQQELDYPLGGEFLVHVMNVRDTFTSDVPF